jgi:hypothetical protein
MEQLSTIESAFVEHHIRGTEFLLANSPGQEEYAAYLEDRMQQFRHGEDVWIARNVEESARMYDLVSFRNHGTVASIGWKEDEKGSGQYMGMLYIDSEKQSAFAEKLHEVRTWITTRGYTPQDTETIFLGMVLTEIERIAREELN